MAPPCITGWRRDPRFWTRISGNSPPPCLLPSACAAVASKPSYGSWPADGSATVWRRVPSGDSPFRWNGGSWGAGCPKRKTCCAHHGWPLMAGSDRRACSRSSPLRPGGARVVCSCGICSSSRLGCARNTRPRRRHRLVAKERTISAVHPGGTRAAESVLRPTRDKAVVWDLYRFGVLVGLRTLPVALRHGLKRLILPVEYIRYAEDVYVLQHLEVRPGARVLDVGSPKLLSLFLAARFGAHVHATDLLDYFFDSSGAYADRVIKPSGLEVVDVSFWGERHVPGERLLLGRRLLRYAMLPLHSPFALWFLSRLGEGEPSRKKVACLTLRKPVAH